MFDIITFGSATQDTFLQLKKDGYQILDSDAFLTSKALCFSLGSKIFIEDLRFFSGGGGTNTAATFAKQGFKVAYVGKVGDDSQGEAIIDELKGLGVSTTFIKKDKEHQTAHSFVLSSPEGERTILLYRGACHFMGKQDMPWLRDSPQWFYLAPLSEKSAELFGPLVDFAKENKIKVAANPGNTQLKLGEKILKPTLAKIDILILNEEEASLLTGISAANEEELIRKAISLCPGIVVMTKGKDGSLVAEGKYILRAGICPVSLVEKTGAGDAFGSGFVAGLLQKNNLKYAMQLATANAAGCVQKIGAKNGLLRKDKWRGWLNIKVKKQPL